MGKKKKFEDEKHFVLIRLALSEPAVKKHLYCDQRYRT